MTDGTPIEIMLATQSPPDTNIFTIIAIVLVGLAIVWLLVRMYGRQSGPAGKGTETSGCEECSSPGAECQGTEEPWKTDLLPILEPTFNLRECAKQIILLEDHLTNPRKTCPDCIRKHFLNIEGLAEEAASLDKDQKYRELCGPLADYIRRCERMYVNGQDPATISQQLRKIRKQLVSQCFDKV